MSKNNVKDMMNRRSPLSATPREAVHPVDMYNQPNAAEIEADPQRRQTVLPVEIDETATAPANNNEDMTQPNDRTVQANGRTERTDRTVMQAEPEASLLAEMEGGIIDQKRPTERFSFEIYTDQKAQLDELQYQYRHKTGKKLSTSRVIREALDEYLERALKR